MLRYFISLHVTHSAPLYGFSYTAQLTFVPVFPFPAHAFLLRPCSSDHIRYRNLYLLSIDYASQPRLRPRLTQGRSALPWKPWIFGRKDSHLSLATHSGILSSYSSTTPYGMASLALRMLLYQCTFVHSTASVSCFSPGTFSAQDLSTSELLRTL